MIKHSMTVKVNEQFYAAIWMNLRTLIEKQVMLGHIQHDTTHKNVQKLAILKNMWFKVKIKSMEKSKGMKHNLE